MNRLGLVVSCEHAGHEVPDPYRRLFADRDDLLTSHRGFDPGTEELGREIAARLDVPLVATSVTRLLVDTNRSPWHRQVFSEISRRLPPLEREEALATFHTPHRLRVAAAVREQLRCGPVLHLGVHSFTPVLAGRRRDLDVGWLYDPRRPAERQLAGRLIAALAARRADLRQRRNRPYLGSADGLTTSLRQSWPQDRYLGIELEVNQRWPLDGGAAWRRLVDDLVVTLEAVTTGN